MPALLGLAKRSPGGVNIGLTQNQGFEPRFLAGDHILLRAVTPVHPGQGRSGGAVDLPVQRDQYGLPMIYASSLKGALKTLFYYKLIEKKDTLKETPCSVFLETDKEDNVDEAEKKKKDKPRVIIEEIMGSELNSGKTKPSKVSLLDAYLLAIPVREQKNVYVYATSPLILSRYKDLVDTISKISKKNNGKDNTGTSDSQVMQLLDCRTGKEGDTGEPLILLDEYKLSCRQPSGDLYEMFVRLASPLKEVLPENGLEKPLVLLDDELMVEVAERALERRTRVALNRETKTVSTGPWTEEYIPRGTVFYTALLYKNEKARECLHAILGGNSGLDMYILVGGNETIGQGILKLRATSISNS